MSFFSLKWQLEKSVLFLPAESALLLVSLPYLGCTPQPSAHAGVVADLIPVYSEAFLGHGALPALDTEEVPGGTSFESKSNLLH